MMRPTLMEGDDFDLDGTLGVAATRGARTTQSDLEAGIVLSELAKSVHRGVPTEVDGTVMGRPAAQRHCTWHGDRDGRRGRGSMQDFKRQIAKQR
jgi:hypothetical protein